MTDGKPAKKAPAKKAGADPRVPKCDYCNKAIDCIPGNAWDRNYWQLDSGVRACDECLAANSDDFEDWSGWERVMALRLLHVHGVDLADLDETVERAREVVVEAQIRNALEFRRTTFELFEEGERLVAMSAGQAYWNLVNGLHGALVNRAAILTGRALDAARRKPKRPELQRWIDSQVIKAMDETARELWVRAPSWITDPDDGIGFDRFTKRVTAARKKAGIGRK